MSARSRPLLAAAALAAAAFVSSSPPDAGAAPVKTLRLAVTDIEGLEALQREWGAFRDLLAQTSGLDVQFHPVPNRTAAVEAFRSGNLDMVLTGPAEYVVFRHRTNAVPLVGFSRPDYFADVIVLAESPVRTPKDLRGKKVALGDVGSTSKHLAPLQLLKDAGLDPLKDFEKLHTSVKLGWEALKRGDVAAFATTNDKYLSLREKEKSMPAGAFRVVARGADLPHDVLIGRPDLDAEVRDAVKRAIVDHSPALVEAILRGEDNQKFKGMKFLPGVEDADYDGVREMFRTAGYAQFAKFPGDQ